MSETQSAIEQLKSLYARAYKARGDLRSGGDYWVVESPDGRIITEPDFARELETFDLEENLDV